jgi:hypothetical protein
MSQYLHQFVGITQKLTAVEYDTLQVQRDFSSEDYWAARRYRLEHELGIDLYQGDDESNKSFFKLFNRLVRK